MRSALRLPGKLGVHSSAARCSQQLSAVFTAAQYSTHLSIPRWCAPARPAVCHISEEEAAGQEKTVAMTANPVTTGLS